MDQDILLYGPIWEYSASYFFDQIKEAQEKFPNSQLVIRINTTGGSPEFMQGLCNKTQELAAAEMLSRIVVDGRADSAGLFMLCYVDDSEAVDTAQGVLHRAAYSDYWESRPEFENSIDAQSLVLANKQLEKAFRAKVNVEVLESLPQFKDKNITLKDIFSLDDRKEVLLSAKDMKAIGLINKIVAITPKKSADITQRTQAFSGCRNIEQYRMAAQSFNESPAPQIEEPKIENTTMTLDEFKSKHPEVFAQAFNAGVIQERDRVGAIMVYADVDPEGVKKIIASGAAMTMTQQAEFGRKAFSASTVASVAAASAPAVTTESQETAKSDADKKKAAFEAEVNMNVGLKTA